MKKLMIGMFAVCAAFAASAASCEWNANKTLIESGALAPNGSAVYFFSNTGATTQNAILTMFGNNQDISTVALDVGSALNNGTSHGSFGSTDDGKLEGAFDAYYVVISKTTGNIFVSNNTPTTYDDGGKAHTWSALAADTTASMSVIGAAKDGFSSAGWYTASAVPEPTSGLLLLLGVAGLALRRRRA